MISYLRYLERNEKIDLDKEIDVIKYYGKSKNVPEEIYPFGIDSNPVTLESVIDYLEYLYFNSTSIDNIAPLIIKENVTLSDRDIEIHYDKLLEKFKELCIKYGNVIKELESRNLKESFFNMVRSKNYGNSVMFHKMVKYLKVNYLKKDKIYDVLKKAEELQINFLEIYDECQQDKDIYEEIKFLEFNRARINGKDELIENGYAGTYIYTDGIKEWLIEKKHNSIDYDHIYTVKVKSANLYII